MNELEKMDEEKETSHDKKRWQAPLLKEVDVSESAGDGCASGGTAGGNCTGGTSVTD